MGQDKSGFTHQERCADPGEGPHGCQVGRFFQHLQLLLPDGQHLVFESQLPGVELEHFDPVENFIHQLNPTVFALHVGYLQREEQSTRIWGWPTHFWPWHQTITPHPYQLRRGLPRVPKLS